jgi:hypothetical protein
MLDVLIDGDERLELSISLGEQRPTPSGSGVQWHLGGLRSEEAHGR